MENPAQDVIPKLEVPEQTERLQDAGRPPSAHIFSTRNVSIYYGSFRAVTDVSLTIYENEITAFIAPSGCGKTTVLRTLNRMNDLVTGARVEGDVHYRGASRLDHGKAYWPPPRRFARPARPWARNTARRNPVNTGGGISGLTVRETPWAPSP
jgi:ABC transporter